MAVTEVEDLLRRLAPQVLGALVRRYGHFDNAEDAVQEAMLAAVTTWPGEGIPDSPRGWLITVASRQLTDRLRSDQARRRREDDEARRVLPDQALVPAADQPAPESDDTLVLLFLCCHPALSPPSQIALTLRAVGGLTTTEGYASTSGPDLHRVELSDEAIRLTRILHRLLGGDAEVAGLLALMLLTNARRAARTGPDGALIPMAEQDRSLWDAEAIAEGVALLSAVLPRGPTGPYQLQAAIAAIHDEAPSAE